MQSNHNKQKAVSTVFCFVQPLQYNCVNWWSKTRYVTYAHYHARLLFDVFTFIFAAKYNIIIRRDVLSLVIFVLHAIWTQPSRIYHKNRSLENLSFVLIWLGKLNMIWKVYAIGSELQSLSSRRTQERVFIQNNAKRFFMLVSTMQYPLLRETSSRVDDIFFFFFVTKH